MDYESTEEFVNNYKDNLFELRREREIRGKWQPFLDCDDFVRLPANLKALSYTLHRKHLE